MSPGGVRPLIVQAGVYRWKTGKEIGAAFDNFVLVEGRLARPMGQ